MQKTYLRPLGLVHGPDARQLIKAGRAGALGGWPSTAFTMTEVIRRDGSTISRETAAYGDLARDELLDAVEARRDESAGAPLVMGIVNVTPDSFSDGGKLEDPEQAIAHGNRLAGEGAGILDVGGESTRPGSEGVSEAEELRRVIPVVEGLSRMGHRVSCDTRKAPVMQAALRAGAAIINDVSALRHDGDSLAVMARETCPIVLMHAQGDPKTMQLSPTYEDVALDVFDMLKARIEACEAAGIARRRLIADPGIGFGKTFRHNLEILRQFTLLHGLGVPLLAGLSRKAFVGALTGEKTAGNRVSGSAAGALWASLHGAHILRVHDVKATVDSLAVGLAAADPEASGL